MKTRALFCYLVVAGVILEAGVAMAGQPPFPRPSLAQRVARLEAAAVVLSNQVRSLQSTVATLQGTVSNLQGSIGVLQTQLTTLQSSGVMALNPYLTVGPDTYGRLTALFRGLNIQLVNGVGTTASINGLGNLIIGYDEACLPSAPPGQCKARCSIGSYETQGTCEANSGTWAVNHKSGSHYLVVGGQNNYSQFGGAVIGLLNTSNNIEATVIGGVGNTASGENANVTGGYGNTASGILASVSGGYNNIASGQLSSVTGGGNNKATGSDTAFATSVSGGSDNIASGDRAGVCGGVANNASGRFSSILGGYGQSTSSDYQTIPPIP